MGNLQEVKFPLLIFKEGWPGPPNSVKTEKPIPGRGGLLEGVIMPGNSNLFGHAMAWPYIMLTSVNVGTCHGMSKTKSSYHRSPSLKKGGEIFHTKTFL
jgi:hypothetical protein